MAHLTEAQILSKASRAKQLLEDSEMRGAFEGVRQALLEKFEQCPIRDIEGQHEIKLMLKLLGDVKANLQSMIDSGKVIESRYSIPERVKKGFNAFRS